MFNPLAFENSQPDGSAVLEILLPPEEATARRFVPLKRTELAGEVTGPLAALRVTHRFRFTREECDRAVAAAYRFPLPGDAAVTGVRVRFGEVEIRTALQEREAAEREYEEAAREGRQAALLTREAPNVFTLQVAGIEPDVEVAVETEYLQLARPEGAGWNLRLPLTTAPRYTRSDELTSRHAQGQPLALFRDPGHRFALDLALPGAAAVSSPTHELAVAETDDRLRVRLREGETIPDRDCVLHWQPRAGDRPALQAWLHDDPEKEHVYFLALVAPPAKPEPGGLPREAIVLVDHSGSMDGPKWAAADWAVGRFLTELTEADAFNLCLFHSTTRWFEPQPLPARAETVARARQFLEEHRDSGGTELGVALEQALRQSRAPERPSRHVLVITDAEVTDEGRILRLADEEAAARDRRRIDVLCIDAAPNSHLALELAERGGGAARFLTSAPDEGDITTALEEVLADWAQPVLAGLRLEVDRPEARAAGRGSLPESAPGRTAIDLGDLPAGRPLWVAGRAPRGNGEPLALRLLTGEGREVASWSGPPDEERRPAVKALFGAREVLGLEFLIHSGYQPDELAAAAARLGHSLPPPAGGRPAVYAENVRADAQAALRERLVAASLDYGLVCSETAFVAAREERGEPVAGRVFVGNALPAGWSERFATGGAFFQKIAYGDANNGDEYDDMLCMEEAEGNGGDYDLAPAAAGMVAEAPPAEREVFSGAPRTAGGSAVLFATDGEAELPASLTLGRLELRFPDGAPEALPAGLTLLLYVGDLAAPRARMRLADLLRQGGSRPLNLRRRRGEPVRLVLEDPEGAWAAGGPRLSVTLAW